LHHRSDTSGGVARGERATHLPRILPWVALLAWALTAAAASYLRPGELIEFALVGLTGLCVWPLLAGVRDHRLQLAAALLFFVPLLNTWPARAGYAQFDALGAVAYLLAPTSVLALLFIGVVAVRRLPTPTAPALAAGAVTAMAVIVSTAVSRDRPGAAAAAWVAIVLPSLVGVVVAGLPRTTRDRYTLLAPPIVASLVPAAMGVTAYVIAFGAPSSLDDLRSAKALLYRTGLLQEVTFGNVAHLAAFGLLAAPAAAAVSLAKTLPRATRAGAGACSVLLAGATVAVYSRAALLVTAAVLTLAAVLVTARTWRGRRMQGIAIASMLVALAVGAGTVAATSLGAPAGPPEPNGLETGPAGQSSVEFRESAIRAGLELFEAHKLGVGAGQYASYDPVHTAPHSLLIRLLVEYGFLGGVIVAALLTALCLRIFHLARAPLPRDEWLLRLGCGLGATGFLAYGLIAGAPLAIGPVAVWALLLAVQLGILFSSPKAVP
jgi:hypothetical protein